MAWTAGLTKKKKEFSLLKRSRRDAGERRVPQVYFSMPEREWRGGRPRDRRRIGGACISTSDENLEPYLVGWGRGYKLVTTSCCAAVAGLLCADKAGCREGLLWCEQQLRFMCLPSSRQMGGRTCQSPSPETLCGPFLGPHWMRVNLSAAMDTDFPNRTTR
jgi:hypothetical protein